MVDREVFPKQRELKSKDDTEIFLTYHTLIVVTQQDMPFLKMVKLLH